MKNDTARATELREKINERWRYNIFNICVVFALIGSIAEIVIYLIDSHTRILFLPDYLYRLRFIYIPSSLNLIVIVITYRCIHSKKMSDKAKNIWSCILIYFLCANTQFIHYVYGPLLMLPVISIFFSVIFGNRKLTCSIAAASLLSLGGATLVSANELRKGDPQLLSDTGLAALVIIVALIGSSLMISYVNEQFQSIANSKTREKILIEELHLDALMGIYNRMALTEKLDSCISANFEDDQMQLLLIDIDNFKNVNDTYGHLSGDNVLIKLSETIRHYTNHNITAYRYGGEEIVIIMQSTTLEEAFSLAQDIRNTFASIVFDFDEPIKVTFSGGLATLHRGQDANSWIKAADDALYISKSSGKNQITKAK